MEGLELNDNSLRGRLPVSLSELSKLRILDVSGNFFTGSVPPEYEHLSSLAALSVSRNSLDGTISDAICNEVVHVVADCTLQCSCCKGCW